MLYMQSEYAVNTKALYLKYVLLIVFVCILYSQKIWQGIIFGGLAD